MPVHVDFDVKYRVDNIENLFGPEDEADEETIRQGQLQAARFVKDALLLRCHQTLARCVCDLSRAGECGAEAEKVPRNPAGVGRVRNSTG